MPTANNPRVTLELEAGADPIRGSIELHGGDRQPFWGWLELIEQLRRVAADEPALPTQPKPANAEPPSGPAAPTERPEARSTTREEP